MIRIGFSRVRVHRSKHDLEDIVDPFRNVLVDTEPAEYSLLLYFNFTNPRNPLLDGFFQSHMN